MDQTTPEDAGNSGWLAVSQLDTSVQHQLLLALVEQSFDACFVLDGAGVILAVNQAGGLLCGVRPAAMLEKPITQFLSLADAVAARALSDLLQGTGNLTLSRRVTLRSGLDRALDLQVQRVLPDFTLLTVRDKSMMRALTATQLAEETRFRLLIDGLPEMVCRFLPDHTVVYVNPAFCSFFNKSAAELEGQIYNPLVLPEDLPEVEARLSQISPEQPQAITVSRVVRRDGSWRWTEWTTHGLFNAQGELTELISLGRDIHDRRLQEDSLRESEERLRLAARATRDYIWDWNLLTNELSFGETLRQVAPGGWPPPAEAFAWWSERIHPDDRDRVTNSLESAIRADENWTDSYRFMRDDGSWVEVVDRGHLVRNERGEVIRMVGSMLDLSEHRKIEEQLARTTEKLQFMLQSAQEGLWEYDFQTGEVFRNRAVWEMLGMSPQEESTSGDYWIERTHPQDVALLYESWEAALKAGRPTWSCNYRLRHSDGHYLHIADQGFFIYSPDGSPLRAFGSMTDRTEKHRAEEELRKREATLALAQTIAHLGSWEWDLITGTQAWSEETFRIFGYDPDEVVPSRAAFYAAVHPEDAELVRTAFTQALEGGKPFDVVHRVVHPDGFIRWANEQCEIIRDPGGAPIMIQGTTLDVTERVRASDEIREREERFRLLADSSPALIYLDDAEGQREYVNVRWLEATGRNQTALLGLGWLDRVHPDDIGSVMERSQQSIRQPEQYQMDYRLRFEDGSWHWLLDSGAPRFGGDGRFLGFIGSCLDITGRKLTEDMQRLLSRLGGVLTGSPDVESSLIRLVQQCVPELCDLCLLDYQSDDPAVESKELRRLALAHQDFSVRQKLMELLPATAADYLVSGGLAWVAATKQTLMIENSLTPDNALGLSPLEPQLQELTAGRSGLLVPLILRGEVRGVLTLINTAERGALHPTIRDTAEEIARRTALAVDNARLYHALQLADQRKEAFLATLAHELRNPSAAILSAAQLLRVPEADDALREYAVELIERQGEHIGRLLEDLMDVSRINEGKVKLRPEVLDLRVVVTHAEKAHRMEIEDRGHELQVLLPADPVWIHGDATRLEQVVSNLLNNAAKYTPGHGHITLRVTIEQPSAEALLSVTDDGMGLEPHLVPHLFEMFFQAERGLARSKGGLGIGLTLVRMLVELHGGVVTASSPGPGLGSTFAIRLPLSAAPTESAASPASDNTVGLPLRVVVVDDNVDVGQTMSRLIAFQGHHVTPLSDSTLAETAIAEVSPDLVLLDIGMPGLDGYTLARRLQSLPCRQGMLLVALTGYGQEEDERLAREAGFDMHRTKPLDRRELGFILTAAQERRTQREA